MNDGEQAAANGCGDQNTSQDAGGDDAKQPAEKPAEKPDEEVVGIPVKTPGRSRSTGETCSPPPWCVMRLVLYEVQSQLRKDMLTAEL